MQKMHKEDKLFNFLMDDNYRTVHSQILNIEPLPCIGSAYAIVAQEEKQGAIATTQVEMPEVATLMTKNQTVSGIR
ncbi:Uncharacterized protein TCM_035432 [Theobroma cacao]|uniref:Uncharacterized protein n=1 Tax=Theobroma cacao TaxID=3641 RepID=A0A061FGY9_THECC|nr:Uncharacterized protein TCM_035432 [Theobroma cacao]